MIRFTHRAIIQPSLFLVCDLLHFNEREASCVCKAQHAARFPKEGIPHLVKMFIDIYITNTPLFGGLAVCVLVKTIQAHATMGVVTQSFPPFFQIVFFDFKSFRKHVFPYGYTHLAHKNLVFLVFLPSDDENYC